jgi:putative sigma-54 modulation protein
MRIDVVGKHMEVTPAIREYAENKANKLPKFFQGVQLITVRLEAKTHKAGQEFHCEVIVDVVKHDDFVSHASGSDLYGCIDLAMQKSERQLHDFKERLKEHRGQTPAGGPTP